MDDDSKYNLDDSKIIVDVEFYYNKKKIMLHIYQESHVYKFNYFI